MNCFLCPSTGLKPTISTSEIEVSSCPDCLHQDARHIKEIKPRTDYHHQYDQGGYLANLEITRRRQARLTLEFLRKNKVDMKGWLDFGFGRGWALNEMKKAGVAKLAGAETSQLALDLIQKQGIEACPVEFKEKEIKVDLSNLSFSPSIISFFDVIEHFPTNGYIETLQNLITKFDSLEYVLIKVPISNGILFKTANLLSKLGLSNILHQLFQVGTFPPHYHYFSKESLQLLIEKLNLEEVKYIDDPDFDNLIGRTPIGKIIPSFLDKFLSQIPFQVAKLVGADSRIVLARVKRL